MYSLYGYEKLYTKDSDWVFIHTYETLQEAEKAKSFKLNRESGRINGGFLGYKIVEEGTKDDF